MSGPDLFCQPRRFRRGATLTLLFTSVLVTGAATGSFPDAGQPDRKSASGTARSGSRHDDVEKAAEAIARCSKLAAFGVGGGSTVAVAEIENRFFRLGIAVNHSSDPRLMRMIAATLGRGDVVLAVSTSGNMTEVIEAANGINLWEQWAQLEIDAAQKRTYKLPATRAEYAGIAISLARQEKPDTSAYNDPEVVYRAEEKNHVGLVVRSPKAA